MNMKRKTSWGNRRIVHDLHWYGADGHDSANGQVVVDEEWLDRYHTFAVEWEEGELRWYVDGELTHRAVQRWTAPGGDGDAPFDQPFFITLNLQVGGWAGTPADPDLPARFEIDWVRVYQ